MYMDEVVLQSVRDKLSARGVDIPELDEQTPENMKKLFDLLDGIAASHLNQFKQSGLDLLDMEQSVKEFWPRSLPLLRIYIALASNISSDFYYENRGENRGHDSLFAVLHELQTRSCQVAGAIFVLLRSGFADDAFARWRTLHEIAIVSTFILKYRKQNSAALYHEHGFSNPKDHKGWAADILGESRVGIRRLEQETGLDQMNELYLEANYNVHIDSFGSSIRRSLSHRQDMVLAGGASVYGLGIVGYYTAISLKRITANLLRTDLDSDFLFALGLLNVLEKEICDAFRNEHISAEESSVGYPNPNNYDVYYL